MNDKDRQYFICVQLSARRSGTIQRYWHERIDSSSASRIENVIRGDNRQHQMKQTFMPVSTVDHCDNIFRNYSSFKQSQQDQDNRFSIEVAQGGSPGTALNFIVQPFFVFFYACAIPRSWYRDLLRRSIWWFGVFQAQHSIAYFSIPLTATPCMVICFVFSGLTDTVEKTFVW